MILEIIIKYWVEFFLGLVATGLGIACKKIYKMYKNEKTHQKTKEEQEFHDSIENLIKEGNEQNKKDKEELQEQINIVKNGVLSIQKKNFEEDCRALLEEGHSITLDEFENLQEEHTTYKSLGGNHDGDTLFDMAIKKATNDLTD